MQIRFLLGPAGSGKTFRCLSEIRSALGESAEGPPLILLAPKQATFQLERQLLGASGSPGPVTGYTRLRILSFERLAEFVFERLGAPVPELLSDEGRVMAIRALLEKQRDQLQLFRSSARMPGFARQLGEAMREMQRHGLTPARLESIAPGRDGENNLGAKLHDLAHMMRAYAQWLARQRLEDADRLLDLAAEAMRAPNAALHIQAVWLDGFAQMTPQERRLLAAVLAHAKQATLAFCLEAEPGRQTPWHSAWAPVAETFLRCRDELRALPEAQMEIETLPRQAGRTRFEHPALRHLEECWGRRDCAGFGAHGEAGAPVAAPPEAPVRLAACADPEAEIAFVAREIRRQVRHNGLRFRDVAVLLRSLEGYHPLIRRIFSLQEIPFFLDRRESVAHHPLAELTRCALRTIARGWEHDDWFGALKTGLVCADDSIIDRLENEALARGGRGRSFWLEPGGSSLCNRPEWRQMVAPFAEFADSMAAAKNAPTGSELAEGLRRLWDRLEISKSLARWSSAESEEAVGARPAVHQPVWEQMNEWLRNMERAFQDEPLPLREWLPVVEAGLGGLSAGVVPPVLDQVLVGTIDRSRNPELQVVFAPGINEGVFPAPPPIPPLLSRADREALAGQGAPLGPDFLTQIGLEHYYGYIACTRARRRLVLTFARRDPQGGQLNPSSFVGELQRLFPALPVENIPPGADWARAEHWSEVMVPALRHPGLAAALEASAAAGSASGMGGLEPALRTWRALKDCGHPRLSPRLAAGIYGPQLRTSVSGLEDFAACPFKFFIGHGLRAGEREAFELDSREKGSFQHEILSQFHWRVQREGRAWRDLAPEQAGALLREVGEGLLPGFRDGLFLATGSRRFTAQLLIEALERLIRVLIGWMGQYQFDPAAVEIDFGLPESRLPAWRLDLGGGHALLLRGRIDRVDVCRSGKPGEALGVVIDYKSSPRQLDRTLLHHGLELQLLAYLGALGQFEEFDPAAKVSRIVPAGAFFVALRAGGGSVRTREEAGGGAAGAGPNGYQHRGRFDGGRLEKFDNRGVTRGDQFRYAINRDGSFSARGNEALPPEEFRELLARIENFLRQHGRDIYAGRVEVYPYRWKRETACDGCPYRPVCRFDPWTQPYNVLRPPPGGDNDPASKNRSRKALP